MDRTRTHLAAPSLGRSVRATGATIVALVLAACAATSPTVPPPSGSVTPEAHQALVDAATREGGLSVIGMPRSWCGYAAVIDGFTAAYGIPVTELDPLATGADQIAAIASDAGDPAAAPDVIDVGLRFGHQAAEDGLLAGHIVPAWDSIPETAKDPDGRWYGGYSGVVSFEVNTANVKHVPLDWTDLLKPEYFGEVALSGDPTTDNEAISSVWASGLAAGESDDAAAQGLAFFSRLSDSGNLLPSIATTATVASGETPIRITWSYHGLADRASLEGDPPIQVVVPRSGRLGGMYVLAMSARAPHPNAARLWMEYATSDEARHARQAGFCHPIPRADPSASAVPSGSPIPSGSDDSDLASAGFLLPTLDQIDAATKVISEGWDGTVGLTIR